jgi:hypothetical protein
VTILPTLIRALAVTLGLLIGIMALDDLFGFVPQSEEPPPLYWRIGHAAVLGVVASALIVPYRRLSSAPLRYAVAAVLVLCTAWMAFKTAVGVQDYSAGRISWHAIPISICVLGVLAANLYAFFALTPKSR